MAEGSDSSDITTVVCLCKELSAKTCKDGNQYQSSVNKKLIDDFMPAKFKKVPRTKVESSVLPIMYRDEAKGKGKVNYFTINEANMDKFCDLFAGVYIEGKKGANKEDAKKEVIHGIAEEKRKKDEAAKNSKGKGNAAVVDRLTDTKKYTGAHKERFDESGKGKGIDGRADRHKNDGYVGQYKEKDTYDKKH